jgi:flagellar assembly protein FliH
MSSTCDTPARTSVVRAGTPGPDLGAFHLEVMDDLHPGSVDDAERRIASAIEDGYESGYQAGHRAAADRAEADAQADRTRFRTRAAGVLDALERAAHELQARELAEANAIEDAIVTGAIELAAALVGRYLAEAEAPGRDALRRALAAAPRTGPITVRLHPDDLAALADLDELEPDRVRLVADPTIAVGGCIADGDAWSIDAQLHTALERVRSAATR